MVYVPQGWINDESPMDMQILMGYGKDNTDTPAKKLTDGLGASEFWTPPGGYVVYVPQGG